MKEDVGILITNNCTVVTCFILLPKPSCSCAFSVLIYIPTMPTYSFNVFFIIMACRAIPMIAFHGVESILYIYIYIYIYILVSTCATMRCIRS